MFIKQEIGDGVTLEFSFSFQIPKGALVNVYKTLSGNTPNEIDDLLPNTVYNLIYTDTESDFTDGKIVFNVAPAIGDYITITPLSNGNTDIDFTSQNELSADNLNLALARHTTPINYSFSLYDDRSVRYAINVKQDQINSYNTLLTPLTDGGFWRRSGDTIISSSYEELKDELENELAKDLIRYTNDSYNWANADINIIYTDHTGRKGYSSYNGAYWSNKWATADGEITDPYGNKGYSAYLWAVRAEQYAAIQGGIIKEIRVTNITGKKVDLIEYNEPWQNVFLNGFSVYKNGLRLSENIDYSTTIIGEPTLENPSYITLTYSLISSDIIIVTRSEGQGEGGMMSRDSINAIITNDSILCDKNMSNASLATESSKGVSKIATTKFVENGNDDQDYITPKKLKYILSKILEPIGQVNYFYASSVPNNYLILDGSHWSKTTYAELYNTVKGLDNVQEDANDFWLPDLRGNFIRTLNTSETGRDKKRQLGSLQADDILRHNHKYNRAKYGENWFLAGSGSQPVIKAQDSDTDVTTSVGNETRPYNIALLTCIKYKLWI